MTGDPQRQKRQRKMKGFTVRAWIGCCDGRIAWDSPLNGRVQTELFRSRADARSAYSDVRRVTIHVEAER